MISPPVLPLTFGPATTAVERGILWTVVYASIFSAPVRRSLLRERLAGAVASDDETAQALSSLVARGVLREEDGYVGLAGAEAGDWARVARGREDATASLLDRHHEILSFIRSLSHVRFAALSGGCAHGTADDGDVDVFVVTEAGALWRTLLVSTLVSKTRGWRRILCMNYLVDETAQTLPWRDFYSAYELISLKPLTGESGHSELLRNNPWVEPVFPNFLPSGGRGQNPPNREPTRSGSELLEVAARMIQRPYLRYRLPRHRGVELSDRVVRLHTSDHRTRLRALFQDALQRMGMEAPPWI